MRASTVAVLFIVLLLAACGDGEPTPASPQRPTELPVSPTSADLGTLEIRVTDAPTAVETTPSPTSTPAPPTPLPSRAVESDTTPDAQDLESGGESAVTPESGLLTGYEEIDVWGEDPESGVSFVAPNAIAVDEDDNVYVTEFVGARVQKFTRNGELLMAWGGQGTEPGQLLRPTGIAIDRHGHLYVSESGNHRVQKFDRAGNLLNVWGEGGSGPGQFLSAMVVTVDAEDRVYVTDWSNMRV